MPDGARDGHNGDRDRDDDEQRPEGSIRDCLPQVDAGLDAPPATFRAVLCHAKVPRIVCREKDTEPEAAKLGLRPTESS